MGSLSSSEQLSAILTLFKRVLHARTPAASVVQSLAAKLLVVALSLCAGIITARVLGPAGRGEQSAIGLWPWLVAGLSTLGVPDALRYHTSKDRTGNDLIAAALVALLAGTSGAVVGVVAIQTALVHHYSPDVVRWAQLMMIFVPINSLFRVFCAFYEAQGDFSKSNASVLSSPIFTLLALIALATLHRLTPVSANVALFAPMVFQSAALGYRLRFRLFARRLELPERLRRIISYGIRGYGSDIMGILSSQADQAMIVAFLAPTALGLYAVALAASRAINILQDSLTMVLFPTASTAEAHIALDLVARVARISSIVSAATIAILMAIVPALIVWFYGAAFSAAADIARVLLIEAFLRGTSSVLLQGFLATNRPGTMTIVQASWLAASLALLTVLVPRMGISGAAYALVLSSLFRLLVVLACYPMVLRKPMPRLIPLDGDFRYVVAKLRMVPER